MKKVFSLLIILVLLLLLPSFSAEPVTIRYGVWMSEQIDGIKAQIAAFEKKYPNIKIKLEHYPWGDYWTKLQTMLAGGDCWDVFTMNAISLPDYAKRGVILEITPLIKRDKVNLNNYPTGVLAVHELNGKYYSLPRDYDTIAIFYNKDAFDEAGVKYPTTAWTWDDVKKAAEKLTKRDSKGVTIRFGVTAAGGSVANSQQFIFPLILSLGGQLLNKEGNKVLFDSPEAKQAFAFAKELTDKGYAPQPGAVSEDLFFSGRSAMNFAGSWMMGFYSANIKDFKWGVAMLPKSNTGKRANISNSLGNVIWSKSKNVEAAWTFVKWLASKEAAEVLGKSGAVIPAYKGTDLLWAANFAKYGKDKDAKVFIDSSKYTYPFPRTPGGSKWFFDRWEGYYVQEIVAGRLELEDGLKEATEEINGIIEEYSK